MRGARGEAVGRLTTWAQRASCSGAAACQLSAHRRYTQHRTLCRVCGLLRFSGRCLETTLHMHLNAETSSVLRVVYWESKGGVCRSLPPTTVHTHHTPHTHGPRRAGARHSVRTATGGTHTAHTHQHKQKERLLRQSIRKHSAHGVSSGARDHDICCMMGGCSQSCLFSSPFA